MSYLQTLLERANSIAAILTLTGLIAVFLPKNLLDGKTEERATELLPDVDLSLYFPLFVEVVYIFTWLGVIFSFIYILSGKECLCVLTIILELVICCIVLLVHILTGLVLPFILKSTKGKLFNWIMGIHSRLPSEDGGS